MGVACVRREVAPAGWLGVWAVSTVLVAGGCAGAGPAALRGDPAAVVQAAAGRTIAAGTARVDVSVGSDLAGTGVVDMAAGSGRFTFQRTGTSAHLGDSFDVVVDGGREWVKAKGAAGGVPGTSAARPWLGGAPASLGVAGRARVAPLDTVLVRPALGTDLAFLRGATKVRPYGGEEVRGVGTYRYSLEVDLAAAIKASPAAQRPDLEAARRSIGAVRWPADVWLDDRGRVRSLQLAEDPQLHTTTTKANLLITEDGNVLGLTNLVFFDFGTAAVITPPAPELTAEAA